MESAEIRRRWLRFFEERGHTVVPSASLIADDPTLLLVPAGMVPFKPYFLGEVKPPVAARHQRAEVRAHARHRRGRQDHPARHVLPDVRQLLLRRLLQGRRHHVRLGAAHHARRTRAATAWTPSGCGSPSTTTTTRPSASGATTVGVPAERIQRLGKKDNYWSMGVPGPVRPLLRDQLRPRPRVRRRGRPRRQRRAVRGDLEPGLHAVRARCRATARRTSRSSATCPAKNIDTGLGLERLAMILQGVQNMYEIDTLRVVIDKATELTGVRYGAEHGSDVSLRVVADHIRTSMMLIGDGVTPGNEGRGYVLRRIMRRAIRNMRLLGATGPVVEDLVDVVINDDGPAVPGAGHRPQAHRDRRPRRGGRLPQDPQGPAPTSSTPPSPRPRPPAARSSPATRRSCCTTPGASRSTSPWRWPPSRASPWTRTASAA